MKRIYTFFSIALLAAIPGWSQLTRETLSQGPRATNHAALLRGLCGSETCMNSVVRFNRGSWAAALSGAPKEGQGIGRRIFVPLPEGGSQEFLISETSILSEEMASKIGRAHV